MSVKARNWVITENYEPLALWDALDQEGLPEGIKYLIIGIEHCPTTGKMHLQGYLQLGCQQRLPWLKSRISHTAHLEPAKGDWQSNYNYCTKEGDWREFGTPTKKSGQRNDLVAICEKAREGVAYEDMARIEEFGPAFIKYGRGIKEYVSILQSKGPRAPPLQIYLFYGPPGCGKTRLAAELWPDAFAKAPQTKWWDNYCGQDTVLFDDHNSAWFTWDYLMCLIDPWGKPMRVETKGGTVELSAKTYVFTCNTHPQEWYTREDKRAHYGALQRRLVNFVEWYRFRDTDPYTVEARSGKIPTKENTNSQNSGAEATAGVSS